MDTIHHKESDDSCFYSYMIILCIILLFCLKVTHCVHLSDNSYNIHIISH